MKYDLISLSEVQRLGNKIEGYKVFIRSVQDKHSTRMELVL